MQLGNPLIDDYYDNIGTHEYWWNHGLISDTTYKLLQTHCPNNSFLFPKNQCNSALSTAYQQFASINPYSIYSKPCSNSASASLHQNHRLAGIDECIVKYTKTYMNRVDVQKALHVHKQNSHPWAPCSSAIRANWSDSPKSMLPIFKELIGSGVRIWVYSGDTDAILPLTATRYSIGALNLKTEREWYSWVDPHSQRVGGWTQVFKGLTYVTVRGAGHEVPLTQPRLALLLFRYFLNNVSLPSFFHQN